MKGSLIDVPTRKFESLFLSRLKRPKGIPDPEFPKEIKGKARLVKFVREGILVDGCIVPFPTSPDGLKQFLRANSRSYHQSFEDEEDKLLESSLTESQLSDLKHTRECRLGGGDYLRKDKQSMVLKEMHGERYRNFLLQNVTHFNNWEEVPDDQVTLSPVLLAAKLAYHDLSLPNIISQGSIAREILTRLAPSGYFPLSLMKPEILAAFYECVKGPSFRAFTIGDSYDVVDSDLVHCYAHILKDTISPGPSFCAYLQSREYQPNAAFCACKIWINLEELEVPPVGVRLNDFILSEGGMAIPRSRELVVHPYGNIREVNIGRPMLWFLMEKLKLRLGKDFGIIEGAWAIPHAKVYSWRDWSFKMEQITDSFPELKWLYRLGAVGGKYQEGTKIGEFKYEYKWRALSTENPVILSHLFEMTKVLTLMGAAQCKEVKGIAADGWVSKGPAPEELGPYTIGGISYGPFPIRNTPLELYYQFNQSKHDKITSIDSRTGEYWRALAEEYYDRPAIDYRIISEDSYGNQKAQLIKYMPSVGENIPEREIELVGDTLGTEIQTRPPHSSEVRGRLRYVQELQMGESRYG